MFEFYSVDDGVYRSEGYFQTVPEILSGLFGSPNGDFEVRYEDFVHRSDTRTLVVT